MSLGDLCFALSTRPPQLRRHVFQAIPVFITFIAAGALPARAQHAHAALPHGVPYFCASPTVTSVASGPWSSGSTWSTGRPPRAGDVAVVRAGTTVTYDAFSDDAVRSLCVEGRLAFVTAANTRLTVGTMLVTEGGDLEVGTVQAPIHEAVTAEIVIANQPLDRGADSEQYGTGMLVFGKIRLHGAPRTPTFARVAGEPRAGSTSLQLAVTPDGWRVGDRLILPDTRQLNADERFGRLSPQFETRTIAAPVVGRQIALNQALTFTHEGARSADRSRLEFLPHVGNLTRNVVIRSANPNGTRGQKLYMILDVLFFV
jgi:hypothetical protein